MTTSFMEFQNLAFRELSTSNIVLIIFLTFLATILYISVNVRPRTIKNLPLVPFNIPFFHGLSLIFPRTRNWVESPCLKFKELAKFYGDVYQIRMGNKLIVVANSYDSIKTLWTDSSVKGNNSRPITHSFHNVLSKGIYTIGTTPLGEDYRKARKHVNQKVLSKRRNTDYNSKVVNEVADEMIERILKKSRNESVVHDDLVRECQYFHLKVALKVTYAFDVNYDDPQHINLIDTIIHIENEITKVRSHVQNVQDYLHDSLRWIWSMFSDYETNAKFLSDAREKYLNLLYDHSLKLYSKFIKGEDVNETAKESLMFDYFHNSQTYMSKSQITSICLTMVSAGLDNVALNFKYGMFQLANNPQIWEEGYQELIHQFTTESDAYESFYKNENCDYIAAIVRETLRMFTVLPMSLPRQTTAPIQYKNAIIPSRSILFMNCWAGNHDLAIFENPMEFIPKRYLDDDGNLNNLKHLSYGIGSRMCLGSQFANRELYILFSKFILKFKPLPNQYLGSTNPLAMNKFPGSLAIEPIDFVISMKTRQ